MPIPKLASRSPSFIPCWRLRSLMRFAIFCASYTKTPP
uniref:Uncharacterized protein n=1 Tax=Myoviridae sp. ctYGJ17 TaxID=2827692 RepID=A0A8S5TIA4_9CAUD|nr:MAG TPA: hypothetical protein [Myoviridae sp. ctYGJ17]DAI96814.1 MAG TPA: hypothetical protein [Caudoviricetes sp.]